MKIWKILTSLFSFLSSWYNLWSLITSTVSIILILIAIPFVLLYVYFTKNITSVTDESPNPEFLRLVEKSKDFDKFGNLFANAAERLVDAGVCTKHGIKEQCGFEKSREQMMEYFIFGGDGTHNRDRWYLNVRTGSITQHRGLFREADDMLARLRGISRL